MLVRAAFVLSAALFIVTPALADGIFADDAHATCRNTGKGTTEASLRKCCREEILSGGLFGPNDPDTKKEVNKCVAMGTGGPIQSQSGTTGGTQAQGANGQQAGQQPADQKKADCPTDGAASAIGGAFGGALGGAVGSAVDRAKCD